jgi:hypothetical protein
LGRRLENRGRNRSGINRIEIHRAHRQTTSRGRAILRG